MSFGILFVILRIEWNRGVDISSCREKFGNDAGWHIERLAQVVPELFIPDRQPICVVAQDRLDLYIFDIYGQQRKKRKKILLRWRAFTEKNREDEPLRRRRNHVRRILDALLHPAR